MINIATKFRPFIHRSYAKCLIPRTNIVLDASPQLLKIGDLEIPLGLDPHLKNFTLQIDLERDCVWVFGKGFRYRIFATNKGVNIVDSKGVKFFPMSLKVDEKKEVERLSFGVHKSQDFELMMRRMDMKEILPILYHLGQKAPSSSADKLDVDFEKFFRSSFSDMLVPRRENVLKQAFESIRSCFVIEDEKRIKLLPKNPFYSGRMVNVQTKFGAMDMHWVKGKLQKVILHVLEDGEVFFDLPGSLSSFRVREQLHLRGYIHEGKDVLRFRKGKLHLDRFHEDSYS